MRRFLAAMVVAMMALGAVPAAADPLDDLAVNVADQIPFRYDVPPAWLDQGLPDAGDDLGFFGVCAPDETGCVGVSQVATSDGGSVAVRTAGLTVAGVICIRSYKAPCVDSNGSPGTGVFLTEVTPTYPEVFGENAEVNVETCVWALAPRDNPTRCTKDLVDAFEIQPVSVTIPEGPAEQFWRAAPDGVVVHTPAL